MGAIKEEWQDHSPCMAGAVFAQDPGTRHTAVMPDDNWSGRSYRLRVFRLFLVCRADGATCCTGSAYGERCGKTL